MCVRELEVLIVPGVVGAFVAGSKVAEFDSVVVFESVLS